MSSARLAPAPHAAIELARYTPAWFTFIAYRLSRGASQHYQAVAGIGIEAWRCLVLLKTGPITAHEICRRLGMDKGSISRCLRGMQARGLVEITLDASDRRARQVALTQRGAAVHDQVAGIALARERAFLSVLAPGERRTLIDLLTRLHDNLPAVEVATQAYVDANFPPTSTTTTQGDDA